MPETLAPAFAPTHRIDGVLVMRNPEWETTHNFQKLWVDAEGAFHRSGKGHKAEPITPRALPPVIPVNTQAGEFGVSYGAVGQIVHSEWWQARYAQIRSRFGVMATREAVAAVLRACAWPDSAAPCGQAGNSNDDDATFENYDEEGNCIVRLFMRGKGYFRVKIPRTMFLEIVDE